MSVNGRIAKLEKKLDPPSRLGAATRRFIDVMLTLAYDPGGVHDLPSPQELDRLEIVSREEHPKLWQAIERCLERIYGGSDF